MRTDRNIYYNGGGVGASMISLSGLFNVVGVTGLRYFNLTISDQIKTSGIGFYGDSLISGLMYMNKIRYISRNGFGVLSNILTLSGLIKAGISSLTCYNLTLSETLTTSGLICFGNA